MSTPTRYVDQLAGEFGLFADEAEEWADATLEVGLECWPDDEGSDQ